MFTFVTSCCSPHISTSQQKSSTECLIWCRSGCLRILPFDTLRELCLSTVSRNICAFGKYLYLLYFLESPTRESWSRVRTLHYLLQRNIRCGGIERIPESLKNSELKSRLEKCLFILRLTQSKTCV